MLTNIINYIVDMKHLNLMTLREQLYDILVYNIDVNDVVWVIFQHMVSNNHIKEEDVMNALLRTYEFFKYYNNNYRPIYHLEHYMLTLVKIIHKDKVSELKT